MDVIYLHFKEFIIMLLSFCLLI